MNVLPAGDNVIPVVLKLKNDKKVEPMDIYQLMIVNFSDPRAVAGDMDTSYIIVNDDDGKMQYSSHTCVISLCSIVVIV